jgi:hypothetical protein
MLAVIKIFMKQKCEIHVLGRTKKNVTFVIKRAIASKQVRTEYIYR